jgi:hypothetical protein
MAEWEPPARFDPEALQAALAAVPPAAWSLPSLVEVTGVHHGYSRVVLVEMAEQFGFVLDRFAPIRDAWLSSIEPGGFILTHHDAGPYFDRWQVPISTSGWMDQGSAESATDGVPFRVQHWNPHSVTNPGASPRVHLVLDRQVIVNSARSPFRLYEQGARPMTETAYRASSSFAVPGPDGMPRVIQEGTLVGHDDPVLKTRGELFQPMSEYIEQTTQAPGEVRPIRIPSGVTAEEASKARDVRDGPRTTPKETVMPHHLPPEHPDSPASPFAPGQPTAGVVADDTPPEQMGADSVKAADAPLITNTPPEPQTPQQAADAEAAKSAGTKSAKAKGK